MPAYPPARHVERWFRKNQRPLPWRTTYDPYSIWISEVMLQQTRMEVVLAYYARFLRRFPTLHALAAATPDEVAAAWSGLGYYRRARMLREGAAVVLQQFGGELPRSVEELTAIPGIGRYTAGAIASIAFGRPAAIVDGNVARILARLFAIDAPLGSPAFMRQAWTHAGELVAASASPRDFNQGLMELGALVCTPRNPACHRCPLRSHCAAYATGRVPELPRPKAKSATRALTIPIYIVTDRRGRVLLRRESGPLMHGMLHLPHGDSSLLPGAPLRVGGEIPIGSFRHTVTNRRITFQVFRATLTGGRRQLHAHWLDPDELASVPHPSYVRKALQLAGMYKL